MDDLKKEMCPLCKTLHTIERIKVGVYKIQTCPSVNLNDTWELHLNWFTPSK